MLAVVFVLDPIQDSRRWSVPVTGMLDEPAHLATAALALMAVFGWPWLLRNRAFTVTALIASMAIDLDHIALYEGVSRISDGGRPFTHSLMTAVVFALLANLIPRASRVLLGASVGVLLHLFRDVAMGPGIPLWWPISVTSVHSSYQRYAVVLVVLALIGTGRILRARTRVAQWPTSVSR